MKMFRYSLMLIALSVTTYISSAQCPASVYNNYKFDEGQGNSASGISGASINLSNITWTTGKLSNAVLLNGTTSKGALSDNFYNWSSNQDFSIEFWFNLKLAQTSNMVLIGRDDPVKSVHWWVGIQSSSLKPVFYLRDNSGINSSVISANPISLNTWYHIAVVRNNATNQNFLYINGQLTGSSQVDYTGDFITAEPVTFGYMKFNGTDSYFSNAEIDELVIHNTTLSISEIQTHYNDQLNGVSICPVQTSPTPLKILPLGNSITYDNRSNDLRPAGQKAGYRIFLYNKLKNARYNFDLIGSEVAGQDLFQDPENGGFPGITKEQLVTLLQTGYNPRTSKQITSGPYLDFFSPDVILLHIGTNSVSTDITAINQILSIIEAHRVQTGKNIKLIIARIINRVAYDAVTYQYNKNLEDAVKAQNSPHNYIVDMEFGAGLDYVSDMNDNLHPNDLGYEKMASLWFSALSGILNPPSETFVRAPANLNSVAQESSITLTWIDNSTNETGFRIERKTESGAFVQIAEVGAGINTYSDANILLLTNYTYRVSAFSQMENSVYSNESKIKSLAGNVINLSPGKTVMQSSTAYSGVPGRAIDNNTNGLWANGSVTHTQNELNAYWQIDLQDVYTINNIEIWNRTDACCITRLNNFYVFVSDVPFSSGNLNTTLAQNGVWNVFSAAYPNPSASFPVNRTGRYVRVQFANQGSLTLAEVKIFGHQGTPPAPTVPAAPSALSAQPLSANSISLNWADNSANESGFRIERKTGNGEFVQIADVTANTTTFSDAGLQPSTSYTYRVFAYSQSGNSGFSNEAQVQTPSDSPSGLSAQAVSPTSVSLTWTDNSANENGFRIERKTGSGVFAQIADVAANTTTFSDAGLQPSTSYTYRVFAFYQSGSSGFSNEAQVQTPSNIVVTNLAPGKTVFQSSTAYSGVPGRAIDNNTNGFWANGSVTHTQNELNAYWQIDLQDVYTINNIEIWNRTDACCITRLNNFYVFVSDVPFSSGNLNTTLAQNGVWNVFSAAYPNPSASFPVNRTGRYVRVQFANQGSLTLAEVKIFGHQGTPPAPTVPAAPSALSAQPLSANSVSLNWADNSANESGFRIERKTGNGEFVQIADVTANTTTFSDAGLQPSTSYTYRVFAYSQAGNSGFSNEAQVQTPSDSPSGLSAQAVSPTSVSLNWTDNSTNESGFRIERKTGSGVFAQIAYVAANTTTFSDAGLQPSTSYTYRVFAFYQSGSSGFSNEAAVTTPSDITIMNLAPGKPVMQSSTAYSGVPERAIDNNTNGRWSIGSVTHTKNELNPYWQIDLQNSYYISQIELWNRTDACCIARLANHYIFVSDAPFESANLNATLSQSGVWHVFNPDYPNPSKLNDVARSGRYVRIQIAAQGELNIAEVKILGGAVNASNLKSYSLTDETQVQPDSSEKKLHNSFSGINVYPNPSSGEVNIEFELAEPTLVSVSITNLLGMEQKLFTTEMFADGHHLFTWDGLNSQGTKAPAGIYFLRVVLNDKIFVKKIILSRTE